MTKTVFDPLNSRDSLKTAKCRAAVRRTPASDAPRIDLFPYHEEGMKRNKMCNYCIDINIDSFKLAWLWCYALSREACQLVTIQINFYPVPTATILASLINCDWSESSRLNRPGNVVKLPVRLCNDSKLAVCESKYSNPRYTLGM
jgi:hypothetical protein